MPLPIVGAIVVAIFDWLGVAIGLARYYLWGKVRIIVIATAERMTVTAITGSIAVLWATLLEYDEFKRALTQYVFERAGIAIDPDNLNDLEAWKIAIGGKLARDINERYGTAFTNLYPLDELIGQVKAQLLLDVTEVAYGRASKLMNQAQSNDFMMQVVNVYKLNHNIPILGAGVTIATTPKRLANRQRQSAYRTTHSRLSLWKNTDNTAFVDAVTAKHVQIVNAKKAYNKAVLSYNRAVAKNAGAVIIQAKLDDMNAKQDLYNQSLIFTVT